MRILCTNDDGWDAPGLAALAGIARKFGEVVCAGPLERRSGCGHQLTLHRPLELAEIEIVLPDGGLCGGWSVDGMPADCVRVAVSCLGPFDLVLSGINDGANLGVDVYLSGTAAAAREACILGIRSIAISQYRADWQMPFDWSRSGEMAEIAIARLLRESPERGEFWNVNLPDWRLSGRPFPPELRFCDLDTSPLPNNYSRTGSTIVYEGRYRERTRKSGMDIDTCFEGNISASCLVL